MRKLAALLPATLIASLVAVALSAARSDRAAPRTFAISGQIAGLYPGDATRLPLTVRNLHRYAIVVSSISTEVSSPRADCSWTNLTVGSFRGRLAVPGHSARRLTVPLTLVDAAPDACQGVRFRLFYRGVATRR